MTYDPRSDLRIVRWIMAAILVLILILLGGPAHAGSPDFFRPELDDQANEWNRIEERHRLRDLERRQQEEDDRDAVEWMRRLEDDSPRDHDR